MTLLQPSSFSEQFASLEITGIQLTGKILGKGSDATVKEVIWVGTSCAAKQLHEILLEDDSPGGAKRFVDNFEKECMTWSKLTHPHIVQFLGVYFLSGSRIPMLILEKIDTSLRHYLESHTKKNFVLPNKIYVLRQVAQALSYLHSRSPPLVHHDLSPNNVLLNEVSLQVKVTDFGMARAIDPSKMTRKSSAKGTQAFMPPEVLHSPPRYDEKLDVFSYGNVIVTTVIHNWPEPGPPNQYEGDKLIALTEYQRREQYLNQFNQIENNLFLPIVSSCLENRPHHRPSSFRLVTQMREIEGSHPRVTASSSRTAPLIQELTIKENTICQKDAQLKQKDAQLEQKDIQLQQQTAQLREQDAELKQQHTLLQQKDAQLKQKDVELRHKDEESGLQYAILLHEHQQLQQKRDELRRECQKLQRKISDFRLLSAKRVRKKPPGNWKDIKCQKILKCGGVCHAVATKGNHIAVGVDHNINLFDRSSNELLHTIGNGQLGDFLPGVTFRDQENILVSDADNNNIKMFTIQGRHARTIDRGSTTFKPWGITLSPDGHIYVCDHANHCVCVFDVNGKFLFSFGSRGSGDEYFDCPRDLCFASDGFLYISDVGNGRICVYDKDGKFIGKFTTTYKPTCIDATDCGHLIVSSFASDKVMIYTTGGYLVHVFGEHGSEVGQFRNPFGVSVDSDGLIYIVDCANHYIQVLFSLLSSVCSQIL